MILQICLSIFFLLFAYLVEAQTIPATVGWHPLTNTKISAVCPSPTTYPSIQGVEGCSAITADWAGGTFDTTGNRLIIMGGGHAGYAGNEVYALNVGALTLTRLNNPSDPVRDGCVNNGTYADGTPVSRHTYNHLEYLPNQNSVFMMGGSQWQCGNFRSDTWLFNLSTLAWSQKTSTNAPSINGFCGAAYDAPNAIVYCRDDFLLKSYNPVTDVWTTRSTSAGYSGYKWAVIDPVRKRYVWGGNGAGATTVYHYDITSPTATGLTRTTATSSGCSIIGNGQIGVAYDSIQDKIVMWDTGNTVYLMDPVTFACTTVVHTGGPTKEPNGTYGRFRYVPNQNAFVVCNRYNVDCHALRLNLQSPADADFAARCNAPGVTKCWGYDNLATDFILNTNVHAGNCTTPSQDTAIKTSGAGSIKFSVLASCPKTADVAGRWEPQANGLTGTTAGFGINSTFWVQFRLRVNVGMLSNVWNSSWKFFELLYQNSTCGNTGLIFVNQGLTDIIAGYTECGNRAIGQGGTGGLNPPYSFQQFDTGVKCDYPEWLGTQYNSRHADCLYFKPDKWITFKYRVDTGTVNGFNSRIQGWYSDEDAPTTMIRYLDTTSNFPIFGSWSTGSVLNTANFSTYMTSMSSCSAPCVDAFMWIDEFIVSTNDIALPGGGTVIAPTLSLNARRRL